MLLEAYRECLRDVFDMPALIETLRAIEQRQLRVHVVETRKPRLLLHRCCSVTLLIFSTTVMRRLQNGVRRPSPSTRISCGNCLVRPTCANCWTPMQSPRWKKQRSAWQRIIARARPMVFTIFACGLAIYPATSWRGAWFRPSFCIMSTGSLVRGDCLSCALAANGAWLLQRMRPATAMVWEFPCRPGLQIGRASCRE